MALKSICPKCSKTSGFEVCEATPTNNDNKVLFIRCGLCGAVVGVMDLQNNNTIIEKLVDIVNRLELKLSNIESEIQRINN